MEKILLIDNLEKSFRHDWTFQLKPALKKINLEVNKAEIFGFLGQNGAGKTTTIKCILGLIRNYTGKIFINGKLRTPSSLNLDIGYLPELPYFYEHLSVIETLEFFSSLYGIKKSKQKIQIKEYLDQVGLSEHAKKPVSKLSKGLKQKLGFAQAILNQPSLLILDEPFSGLDPIARAQMREWILNINKTGTSVFMSSHILSDVEEICQRVCILKRGEVKSCFSMENISENTTKKYELSFLSTTDALTKFSFQSQAKNLNDQVFSAIFSNYDSAEMALHEVLHARQRIIKFSPIHSKLEDIYLEINQGEE